MPPNRFYIIIFCIYVVFHACSKFIVSNPPRKIPVSEKPPNPPLTAPPQNVDSVSSFDSTTSLADDSLTFPLETALSDTQESNNKADLDFALAFLDSFDLNYSLDPIEEESISLPEKSTKMQYKPLYISTQRARIALSLNLKKAVIYFLGSAFIHAYEDGRNLSCRGRVVITSDGSKNAGSKIIIETSTKDQFHLFLPCTLQAKSSYNYFEYENKSYRGSLILSKSNRDGFTVINYCDVEEYLRGVVPLEIGNRSTREIEAVKAQAIAARTYTYKRILERQKESYDLKSTVADQVYGGVNAEQPVSDRAIIQTKDQVMTYKGDLIMAYYHSTCGGMTANITQVWNMSPKPYLRSVSDRNRNGKPYCAMASFYTWDESWDTKTLASIITQYCRSAFPSKSPFHGNIKQMDIAERYPCGRIAALMIKTNNSTFSYGGDKIRFCLRREKKWRPIMRSANFSLVSVDSKRVVVTGRGFGHGVGMCQMGAIGRARAGFSYISILKAYYTGVDIAEIAIR